MEALKVKASPRVKQILPLPIIPLLKKHGELIAAIISGLLIGLGFLFPAHAPLFFVTAFVIGGYAKAKEGLTDLFVNKKLNVEILMILAAIGSAIIGFWAEGAILIFIFALSGALETYTLNKSEKELSSLVKMQPDKATLLTDQGEKVVPVSTLNIKNVILVKPGERIPVDGFVKDGHSSVDEAAISGEAVPVFKQKGDEVFAGTVNVNGALKIDVSKEQKDTLFQRIIDLVKAAKNEKSPAQQFIERFEGTYVKIVLIVVFFMLFLPHYALGWSWQETWYRAMVLLVVASPCALVASIMPATLSAIASSAKKGILFKGGNHLESLASLKAIAFDKTGTMTKGKHEVTDVAVRNGMDEDLFLQAVASVEKQSNHPLAIAIVRYAENKNISFLSTENLTDFAGKGVSATINGKEWRIGKPSFVSKDGNDAFLKKAKQFEAEGKSIIYAGDDNGIAGIIMLKDTIRTEAKEAIEKLKQSGLHTIMITGDGKGAAQAISKEAGMDLYLPDTLPEEKLVEIKKLRETYGPVAMIGDGINDAPALATADIGIAMGGGTDIALETADIVLMKNDLKRIPEAIKLSKKMNRIVKQNIVFSIAVILVLIASNFMQIIDLPFGVIGHEGSTLLVILNGLRMLKN
ncbi:cadmium-translocating P-type ATPase [Pueribacillus theae]|uniref:Cadmium-translocating P-type ATPase n=1 Tax=Pueribacillus theae TaxID=2171751 RepID=A0A2U1JYV1_9BACI|nr:heavy metal translocating P-type ATPase [Pueribacillus theae]PWA10407.1 cadmium-translocating P-type ATPase [Pueribacillus theae]